MVFDQQIPPVVLVWKVKEALESLIGLPIRKASLVTDVSFFAVGFCILKKSVSLTCFLKDNQKIFLGTN